MAKQSQRFVWEVSDGTMTVRDRTKDNALVFEADATEYPQRVLDFLLDHGLKTKFQQFTSDVPASQKVEAWEKLDALFRAGELQLESVRGAPAIGAWIVALAEHKGVEPGVLQHQLNSYSKEARADLRANVEAKLADKIREIQARRTESVDLSDFE